VLLIANLLCDGYILVRDLYSLVKLKMFFQENTSISSDSSGDSTSSFSSSDYILSSKSKSKSRRAFLKHWNSRDTRLSSLDHIRKARYVKKVIWSLLIIVFLASLAILYVAPLSYCSFSCTKRKLTKKNQNLAFPNPYRSESASNTPAT
jgi:hypothetical protein